MTGDDSPEGQGREEEVVRMGATFASGGVAQWLWAKRGSGVRLHGSNRETRMSAPGQSRRFAFAGCMSVLTPIATEIAICVHVG
jgi:hypothetical protein